jgi:hypothetical protein
MESACKVFPGLVSSLRMVQTRAYTWGDALINCSPHQRTAAPVKGRAGPYAGEASWPPRIYTIALQMAVRSSPSRRPLSPQRLHILICVTPSVDPGVIIRLEELCKLENSSDLMANPPLDLWRVALFVYKPRRSVVTLKLSRTEFPISLLCGTT